MSIQKFSDFSEENQNLVGEKLPVRKIFDKEVVVKAYRVMDSKAVPGKSCAQIQVELGGKDYVVFTTSMVILRQLKQYADKMPFSTTMRCMGRYHTFT